jgi:alpha-1,2-mannosyltransferase
VVGAAAIVVSPVSWTHHQFWLVAAAVLLTPVDAVRAAPARVWTAIAVGVLAVAPAPLPPGWPAPLSAVTENSHLLLALAVVAGGVVLARRTAAEVPAARELTPASPG